MFAVSKSFLIVFVSEIATNVIHYVTANICCVSKTCNSAVNSNTCYCLEISVDVYKKYDLLHKQISYLIDIYSLPVQYISLKEVKWISKRLSDLNLTKHMESILVIFCWDEIASRCFLRSWKAHALIFKVDGNR